VFANLYGVRRLRDPAFRRLVLVLIAVILVLFRVTQFAVWTTRIQWGYDFSAYWTAASHLLDGLPIYAADQLSGPYAPQRQFLYLYPPPLAAAVMPLAALIPGDYRAAAWVWVAMDAAILVAGTLAVARSIGLMDRVRAATGFGPWILLVAVFSLPPVVGELVLGNVHILLFGLLSVAWLGIRSGDRAGERWAGIAVGLAAVVKVFPALIVVWFLLTGRRTAVAWFVVGVVLAVALTLPFTGLGPWLDFPAALLNLSAPSDTTDTLAPTVWLAALVGFTWARILVTGVALGLLAWFSDRLSSRRGFVLAVLLSVLVAPALYHHYLAILALPFLLLLVEDGIVPWLALAYVLMSGGDQAALGDLSWIVNRAMPTAAALLLVGLALFHEGGVRPAGRPQPPTVGLPDRPAA
jgi:hypothetical protein